MGSETDVRLLTTFLTLLTVCFLFIASCSAAPSPYGKLRSPREKGCYYLLKHYENGEQIETNEPCLNCSCVNSMLMCYLRVCPYVRPIGDKCLIEKVPGDCCPRITCTDGTDVPPDPEPEPTTPQPEEEAGAGCYVEDKHFREGAQMPPDPRKPCEICYCIRNTSACVSQECSLGVPGCSPMYSPTSCCPTRYNCSAEAATTVPPELRHPSVPEFGCRANGRTYVDGEAVPSKDPCEHCYCMKHEVVCAVQECKAPCEGCTPIPSENDHCCPERYECPAPRRPVPHRDIFSNETHGVTSTAPTVAVNRRIESETPESLSPNEQSSTAPPLTSSGTPEPEQSSTTAQSASDLSPDPASTTHVPDDISSTEISIIDKPGSMKEVPPEPSISGQSEASSTAHSVDPTTGTHVSPDATSTGQGSSEKSTIMPESGTSAIPIEMKGGPEDGESGSTSGNSSSQILGSSGDITSRPEIPVSPDEKKQSEFFTTTTPDSDGTEGEPVTEFHGSGLIVIAVTTESLVIKVPVENMLMPASQPRRDEAGDGISTRRPGTQRKTFPSAGVIPGEGICRYEGKVYQNGDEVVSHNPCVEFCMCINSVVYCDETVCQDIKPIEGRNCTKVKSPSECCPRYECQPVITSSSTIFTTEATTPSTPTEAPRATSTQAAEVTETSSSPQTDVVITSTGSSAATEIPIYAQTKQSSSVSTEITTATVILNPTTPSPTTVLSEETKTEKSATTIISSEPPTTSQPDEASPSSPTTEPNTNPPVDQSEPAMDNEIQTETSVKTTPDVTPSIPDPESPVTSPSEMHSSMPPASTASTDSSSPSSPDAIPEVPTTEQPISIPPEEMKLDSNNESSSFTSHTTMTTPASVSDEIEHEITTSSPAVISDEPNDLTNTDSPLPPAAITTTKISLDVKTQTSEGRIDLSTSSTTAVPTAQSSTTEPPVTLVPSDLSTEISEVDKNRESPIKLPAATVLPDEVNEPVELTTEASASPAAISVTAGVEYEKESSTEQPLVSEASPVPIDSHPSTPGVDEATTSSEYVTEMRLVSTETSSTTTEADGFSPTTTADDVSESKSDQPSSSSTLAQTAPTETMTSPKSDSPEPSTPPPDEPPTTSAKDDAVNILPENTPAPSIGDSKSESPVGTEDPDIPVTAPAEMISPIVTTESEPSSTSLPITTSAVPLTSSEVASVPSEVKDEATTTSPDEIRVDDSSTSQSTSPSTSSPPMITSESDSGHTQQVVDVSEPSTSVHTEISVETSSADSADDGIKTSSLPTTDESEVTSPAEMRIVSTTESGTTRISSSVSPATAMSESPVPEVDPGDEVTTPATKVDLPNEGNVSGTRDDAPTSTTSSPAVSIDERDDTISVTTTSTKADETSEQPVSIVTEAPSSTPESAVTMNNTVTVTFFPNSTTTFTVSSTEPSSISPTTESVTSTPGPKIVITESSVSSEATTMTASFVTAATSNDTSTSLTVREELEEEDDTACIYEGKAYRSAEQVPRSHPCDFCFCFRGDIICLQQTCPPPIPGCTETPISGFCCPRYECHVSSSSSSNSTTPRSIPEAKGCNVNGQFFEIGESIKRASNPCLQCLCDHSGMVQCNPQECSPDAPLLLRMNREFLMASRKKR